MSRKIISSIILVLVLTIGLAGFSTRGEAKPFFGRTIQLAPQTVAPGTGEILIDFTLPPHHEFAPEAPSTVWVRFKDPAIFKTNPVMEHPRALDPTLLPHSIPYEAAEGKTVVVLDLKVHFCDKQTQICLTDTLRIKFLVQVQPNAPSRLSFKIPLRSPTAS